MNRLQLEQKKIDKINEQLRVTIILAIILLISFILKFINQIEYSFSAFLVLWLFLFYIYNKERGDIL